MPAVARLTLLFSLIGLLASRIGLLVHEFIGHGGAAFALGGSVPAWRLFLFGGGWIQYERNPWYSSFEQHSIALAGVALQSLVAALIWYRSRERPGLAASMARLIAMLLWAHACVYLALGVHYGFGDGRLLHESLSSTERAVLIVLVVGALVYLSYALTRGALLLAASLGKSVGAIRAASAALAVTLAAGAHFGLYYAESRVIDPDETYASIMQQEIDRKLALHMAELQRLRLAQGVEWNVQEVAAEKQAFVSRHEPFPLRPLVYLLCALVAVAAAFRHARTQARLPAPWNRGTAIAATLSLALLLGTIAVVNSFG